FRSTPFKGAASGVVVPAFGSAGEPTVQGSSGGGASLVIYNTAFAKKVTIPLPIAGWQRAPSGSAPGYRYRDPLRVRGPITALTLRNGRLSFQGKGAALYTLDNAPQGSM